MKKILLVLVVMFAFMMNTNAQDIAMASIDANDNTPVLFEENNLPTETITISDKLLQIAKDYLKSDNDDDYKIIKFYHVDGMTTPVFHNSGKIRSFYLYLERNGRIIVCQYTRPEGGKVSVRIVGRYASPVKKQISL